MASGRSWDRRRTAKRERLAAVGDLTDGKLLDPVRLRERLAAVERRTPALRFLTNRRGRAVDSADAVLDDLAEAVEHTVQWYDAARLLGELGVTHAVEVLPGHVLTRLLPAGIAGYALEDDGLETVAARLSRRS